MHRTHHDDEPYLHNDNSSDPDYAHDYQDDDPSRKKTGKWTAEEDKLLQKYVPLYGEKQWRKISEHIPGRSSIQCLHRWTKILKPGLVKGPWTAEEDQRLMTWVKTEGPTKWAQAANFITGRSGKQCRERWFNNLNPNVKKGNWSKEEDELIYELYQKYGTSWSKIAKLIPGRTENALKNRFYSTLRKLAADQRKLKDDVLLQNGTTVAAAAGPGAPGSHKSDSAEEAYDQAMQSTSPGEVLADPPNTLYKLLQEKTQPVEVGGSPLKVEMVKMGKEMIYEDGEEAAPNPTSNLNNSNIMALKIGQMEQKAEIVRENMIKPTVVNTVKEHGFKGNLPVMAEIEFENNEWTFEQFLLSLDGETNPGEFIIRENHVNTLTQDTEDAERFDYLQQKILNYCQDNIQSLAEAFKTMANNNNDTSPLSSETKTKAKTVTQILPLQTSTTGFKIEASTGGLYQENIKGIRISAPMPVTRINFNNKGNMGNSPSPLPQKENSNTYNSGNLANFMKHEDDYAQQGYAMMPQLISNRSSPAKGYESPQINNMDLFGQRMNSGSDIFMATTPVKNKVTMQNIQNMQNMQKREQHVVPNGFNEWDYSNAHHAHHQNKFHNMIEPASSAAAMAQNAVAVVGNGNREEDENDKKMNFLFQQLYSLEGLLANARHELIKLEGTLNDNGERENPYKGLNRMVKEEKPMRMRLEEYNDVFGSPAEDLEQIVKKRRHM